MSILPALDGCYSKPLTSSSANDLFTERITYPGAAGDMKAYVARPYKEKKYATVVVIHENRGLNPHIEDVARRVAIAGEILFAAFAVYRGFAKPYLEYSCNNFFSFSLRLLIPFL